MRNLFVNFYFFSVFLLFTGSISTYAQRILFVSTSDSTTQDFPVKPDITDSLSILEVIQNHGYWNVNIDRISLKPTITVFGELNQPYLLTQVTNLHHLDKKLRQRIYNKQTVYEVNQEILNYYSNKGYLFSNIIWIIDSISTLDHSWQGQVQVTPNTLQYLDSVIVKSEPILKLKKWNKILLPKQKLATPRIEQFADAKLKALSFIELNKPSKLLVTDKKNLLFIFPKKKNVNFANGLLAFSNDKTDNASGFTGNFNLHLENILKSAEVFDIKWKAGNGNQDFKWRNSFKYLYQSLGLENEVNIYQQDSSFTKTQLSLGLRIDSKPQSIWTINYLYEQSAVDEPSLTRINYKKHLLRISWLNSNLESNYFDHSGHRIHLRASIGNRITTENTEAEYQIQGAFVKIIPVSNTLKLVGEIQHRQLILNTVLENNAYSFGGFENMKGFIENRFLTTRYSLFTPTLRFTQQNRYVAELFYQHGLIRTIDKKNERLQSFGLQFILPVKSGWFNFGVSSGRVHPEAFNFSQALIHFGVKNKL